jgi:hypothetical protein
LAKLPSIFSRDLQHAFAGGKSAIKADIDSVELDYQELTNKIAGVESLRYRPLIRSPNKL